MSRLVVYGAFYGIIIIGTVVKKSGPRLGSDPHLELDLRRLFRANHAPIQVNAAKQPIH